VFEVELPLPGSSGDIKRIGQVNGSAAGYIINQAAQKTDGVTVVVTNDSDSANRLQQEVSFYQQQTTLEILSYPDWETLPYDSFSPHQDIISERIHTLHRLPLVKQGILIVPVSTLMHRTPPPAFVSGHALILKTGQTLDPGRLRSQLSEAGYHAVDTVYEHGEFAIRGSIIDIYPMGSPLPYRIDLFDDEVDTLRSFDPENQRSIETLKEIKLLPAREFPLHQQAVTGFKQRWRELFDVDYRKCPIYQDIDSGLTPPGIEYYMPLFFDQCATLLDYLPSDSLIICDQGLEGAAENFWRDVLIRYEDYRYDIERPILEPASVFLPLEQLFSSLKQTRRLILSEAQIEKKAGRQNLNCSIPADLSVNSQADNPYERLQTYLASAQLPVLLCAESAGRREALLELLQKISIKATAFDDWQSFTESPEKLGITTHPLEHGLVLDQHCIVITETQLFGRQVFQRRRRSKDKQQSDQVIKNLTELHEGAPVVHLDHGVGRYIGMQTIELNNQASEFLTLEYADQSKLYVPVSSLHLISRYTGTTDELAPLHKLGSEQWSKAKRKAAEKARDAAAELLDIYARRAARKGFQFSSPDSDYLRFSSDFPFEETPDQASAINAVIHDMTAPQPMDRLVCGDVGFGKTEVAMRAAFMAVQSGKQVVVLVPTTLLATQHYNNFQDRFADWPVNVELISRFRTTKETDNVLDQLADGSADIVIGTHKLLQAKGSFKNLGLLIIDEEHRFGVAQKEKIKSLRAEVDILTLTATPIPRTLNMAMSGIRDLSIIATPPAKRLSVKTFVRQSDDKTAKEALLRELLRGGQVYYLHNDIKTIARTAEKITELVPEARVAIGHGQMRERELEQVMSDFYHKRYNVLVCTTIIETGIDIPSANTIIIDRSDKFGLAQLHQLRGRVGRSHHQAYAYLLTPHKKAMTKDAVKRLEAISQSTDLGAGFTLATHDLEIRGAGELLGDEQSGQIQNIGFSLYTEMLEQAVEAIKEGKTPNLEAPLQRGAEINLNIAALIPEDYLPDVHNRLILYKRISSCKKDSELKELQVEMIDRFGLLPESCKNLFRITKLKLKAAKVGIEKIDAGEQSGRIYFAADTKIDPLTLVKMVQNQPQRYKLEGASQLKFSMDMEKPEQRFLNVEKLMSNLAA